MLHILRTWAGVSGGITAVLVTFILAHALCAQAPTQSSQKDSSKSATTKDEISRWFEIEQLSVSSRYHFIENANRVKASNSFQYQFVGKFRFKFDKDGKYSIEFVECLASCGFGPVCMINDDFYEAVSQEEVPQLLEKYQ